MPLDACARRRNGQPTGGVALELRRLGADGTTELLAQAVTSTDGRTDAPLLHGHQLLRGTYEFTFAVGSISAPVP